MNQSHTKYELAEYAKRAPRTHYKELIERDGGFTVDLLGNRPLRGYIVSLSGYTSRIPLTLFEDNDVSEFATLHSPKLFKPLHYIGAWVEDGEVWLDVSEQLFSRDGAIQAGISRNQIAIWDVVNKCEIATGGSGD